MTPTVWSFTTLQFTTKTESVSLASDVFWKGFSIFNRYQNLIRIFSQASSRGHYDNTSQQPQKPPVTIQSLLKIEFPSPLSPTLTPVIVTKLNDRPLIDRPLIIHPSSPRLSMFIIEKGHYIDREYSIDHSFTFVTVTWISVACVTMKKDCGLTVAKSLASRIGFIDTMCMPIRFHLTSFYDVSIASFYSINLPLESSSTSLQTWDFLWVPLVRV